MKALLLTVEDGISPDIWLAHAKAFLAQNRIVLAITEADNISEAVGTGDGLPGYGPELKAHAHFINRKVTLDEPLQLISEINQLPSNAVILWNMSVFEWAVRDVRWKDVLDTCVRTTCDVLFMHYAYSSWAHGQTDPKDELVGSISWDYVAGSRISTRFNHQFARQMLPHLNKELDKVCKVEFNPRAGRWEVLRKRSSRVIVGPWQGLSQRAEILHSLASCNEMQETFISRIWSRLGLR